MIAVGVGILVESLSVERCGAMETVGMPVRPVPEARRVNIEPPSWTVVVAGGFFPVIIWLKKLIRTFISVTQFLLKSVALLADEIEVAGAARRPVVYGHGDDDDNADGEADD